MTQARVESVPAPTARFSVDISPPVDPFAMIRSASARVSNTPVSRDLALSVTSVLRGRNLLCSIATLPLGTIDAEREPVSAPLLEQIDPNVANVVTLAQTVEDLVFEGTSWWQVTRRAQGWPTAAIHLDHDTVSLTPPADAWPWLRTLPSGLQLPGGVVWVNGKPVAGKDMIRFDSPNPGVLRHAARAIRRAVLLEKAAEVYATDPRPLDYFSPVEGSDPIDDDEISDILADWADARRERSTGYVPAALKYNTVDALSPADLQLADLQKQATIDIANALGLDAEDLQVSTTSRTYANAVDRRRDRINDVLAMYMQAITDRLSMNDVTRRGQKVRFDLDDYLRADPLTRWQTYEIGLRNEVISVAEVRTEEQLPAVPVEPAARPARQRARSDSATQEAGMTRTPTHANFAEETSAVVAFDVPAADAAFTVDVESRTISGLLVPWNKVARSGWAKYRFSKDSLSWSDTSRVKLNLDHDRSSASAIAYATDLQSTDAGLVGTFKVARGPEGDAALMKADDKVLDGFSIEAEFSEDGSSWGMDPDDDMVRLVSSARLAGVALTAFPAFDDARVSGVKASRKEPEMTGKPDAPQGQEQETPAAGLTPEAVAAFTNAVEAFTANNGTMAEAITKLAEAQTNAGEQPEVVDPTKLQQQFQVTEEPLYRFDGLRGKHDFSSDLIAGAKGDGEALARAEEFVSANFSKPVIGAEFVSKADVATLNPARQRPDMYVDQLEYVTPIWDSIVKGTLPDSTPFILPKFGSASGEVADHTEGTEPTPGTFTTTSQTITPTAVSGKYVINREVWDQGGNPQFSTILWRQIVRAYDEALEQSASAMLEALTGLTTVTLTAGAIDAALAKEVKEALAGLHFARGGFRFRDFKLEKGLYTALAAAQDTTGRPFFPVVGGMNADGSMAPLFGALNLAGLAGVPAWALPFTDGAPNDSYLYNNEDVHGWASAPQRLQFEYQVKSIEIGVWGYKATACTRTDGVRKFTYDNAA